MRQTLITITTLSLLCLLTHCSEPVTFDKTIISKANKITQLVDSNSLKTFRQWNYYGVHDKDEMWAKLSGDTTKYICLYKFRNDTFSLKLDHPYDFMENFPCSLLFDTLSFEQFIFDLHKNKIFRITFVDKNKESHIKDTMILIQNLFTKSNPFETLGKMSRFKADLDVNTIEYGGDMENFIDFWISNNEKLTYSFNNNLGIKHQKSDNFSEGKTIKPNWTLYKRDK